MNYSIHVICALLVLQTHDESDNIPLFTSNNNNEHTDWLYN